MLTDSIVARIEAIAGADFSYAGTSGTGRPSANFNGGSPRRGLKAYLYAAQGGLCPACGLDLAWEGSELAHMVSRGPGIKGFMPANLAVEHSHCNTMQKDKGPVVRPADLARPDLIVTCWPCEAASGFYVYDPQRGA
jgi:hypothetical protein